MQELLQALFEKECRNYEFYLRQYNSVAEQYDALTKREDEICQEKKIANKVNEMARLLTSEEFIKEKENIGLPDNFEEFEEAFSRYKPKYTSDEIRTLSLKKAVLEDFLEKLRESRKKSTEIIFDYINIAYRRNIKFSFSKNDETATKMFVLYYNSHSFRFNQAKNVIELNNCQLNEEFLSAYKAKTEEEQKKAQIWFEETAKKYKDF